MSKDSEDWIVKFVRRRDGKVYYYRHDGNLTARRESSWRFDVGVATQLAIAITKWHKNDAIGLKWLVNTCWLPRWKEVVKEGPLKIAKYRQRCCVRTRSYFDRWLKQMGIAIPNAVEAAKPFDPLAGLGL